MAAKFYNWVVLYTNLLINNFVHIVQLDVSYCRKCKMRTMLVHQIHLSLIRSAKAKLRQSDGTKTSRFSFTCEPICLSDI